MAKTAAWTVMVYLAGDNNLTTECMFALTEMKQAAVGKQLKSPYAWAGFVIQGQYDQKESFSPTGSGKTIPAVIAFIGGSFLASVLFLRRRRHLTINA